MTQDIATEIKSELREVISKVDNVLENTEPLASSSFNLSPFQHLSSAADEMKGSCSGGGGGSDAVSATEVAQYLREFSIEMASEVKSEIREMCATVKDFNEHPRRSSPTDLEGLKMCLREVMGDPNSSTHRRSDTVIGAAAAVAARCGSDDVLKPMPSRSESFPSQCGASAGHPPSRHTGAISKLSDSTETASRDSGINMCFGDGDLSQSAFNARYEFHYLDTSSVFTWML